MFVLVFKFRVQDEYDWKAVWKLFRYYVYFPGVCYIFDYCNIQDVCTVMSKVDVDVFFRRYDDNIWFNPRIIELTVPDVMFCVSGKDDGNIAI